MHRLKRLLPRRIAQLISPHTRDESQDKSLTRFKEIKTIYALKAQYVTRVTQPLLLISQVQRSGGTLLSQLFDNHPECYAHPSELKFGYPKKHHYPEISFDDAPEVWFDRLFEKGVRALFREGYRKFPESAVYDKEDHFPFYFLPNLQREIFLNAVSQTPPATQRDVLNIYFTSFFNAWLDYQGQYLPKRYITAFTPRLATEPGNAKKFFADYPDGRLIHVIRDPKSWYASAHKQRMNDYPDPQTALPDWAESAKAMIENKEQFGDGVRIIQFEQLLHDTRGVMQNVAAWAGLTWDETLVEPTFQGQQIKANTAFTTTQYGVLKEPLKRGSVLPESDAAYIEAQAGILYRRVLEKCE